ncbi:MAG: hypothetical protein WKF92_05635 [Pyrinomonadaceae bacterium]
MMGIVMKDVRKAYEIVLPEFSKYLTFVLISVISVVSAMAQTQVSPKAGSDVSEFISRANLYVRELETLKKTLTKLSKHSTAEEISAYKNELLKIVLAKRKGLARGNIFTRRSERLIRLIIASQYKGRDRALLKKELAEAENASVPVKVNAVYPEASELLEMPPTLLLALPELPKQIRYRFVGTHLLLVDRENHLIIDYMPKALP